MVNESLLGEPSHPGQAEDPGRRRPWNNAAAWLLLGCGVLCLLFAEIWLVESEYYAFGELSSRWWLAICLLVLIVSLAVLTGAITIRAISAFRGRSDGTSFLKLSAICLGVGVIEVVVAVFIAIVVTIVLSGAPQIIPTVHVH
jgi:hypothetical protein